MSGGIRTSVKGYLNAKRLSLTTEIDTVHEMHETINRNFTALQAQNGAFAIHTILCFAMCHFVISKFASFSFAL